MIERVGLIGAGGVSHVHAQAWRELGRTVTVYSLDGAPELARQYGFELADDLDEVLRTSDLIDVVTPTPSHREITVAALEAGLPVICEKPLGATQADAVAVAEAARAAGLPVFPAHVVRYMPDYAALKAALDAGRIGPVAIARWWRHGEAPGAGSWFHDESAGGGIVRDLMIHDLDQALWQLGEVVEVYGVQSGASETGEPNAVAVAVLTHASGAISQLTASWGPRGTTFRTGYAVFGAEGMLRSDSDRNGPYLADVPGDAASSGYMPPQTRAVSPYTAEIAGFLDVVEGREAAARVGVDDGVAAVALAELVMQSIAEGRAIPVGRVDAAERESGELR
ncbi:MAG: Gfo/Idh/MocA family oxidoreductase [Microbacteriaceae bacterium]|nr:Gfo/Idh/MocA family oxidoreductase [Microbacteriaceae bacterium]MCL2796248.1 Gfo/Idh/MocA family oxidoreductase [Microbacteriaceae bacterium]